MTDLIIAADLSALRSAAATVDGATGGGGFAPATPGVGQAVGHAGADAAIADFHTAMGQHGATIAGRAAQGAASMSSYFVAFYTAGE